MLLYLGDLAPVFEAAASSFRLGGMFAFSVEAAPTGDRYQVEFKSRRYSHTEVYLHHLAAIYGFEEASSRLPLDG